MCAQIFRLSASERDSAGQARRPVSACADDVSLGLIECAPEWKPDMFDHKAFKSTHAIFQCLSEPCPSLFYWPFTRKRWWGIVVRRDRRLVKAWQTFVAPLQQIASPFPGGGTGPLTGHSLFCDSRERVQAELIEAAKRQQSTILPGEKLNYEDHALNTSQANHLRLFKVAHEEWKKKLCDQQKEIPNGAKDLIADLEHNPDQRPRFWRPPNQHNNFTQSFSRAREGEARTLHEFLRALVSFQGIFTESIKYWTGRDC